MCGIAGIISADNNHVITDMTKVMIHRGPDEEGYYHDDVISLGQRRLSIIDLDGGRQPISNEDDNLQLICNGEIYNSPELRQKLIQTGHIFKTSTDVEVILHLYEEHSQGLRQVSSRDVRFCYLGQNEQGPFPGKGPLGAKTIVFLSE